MIRVIIVDDEANSREALANDLRIYCPDVQILEYCSNIPDAVKAINKHEPDIVFSDVEMPMISGLQILDFFDLKTISFELIFVTSFAEYAVKAFQLSATDYLLKPVDTELLQNAVEKVRKKQNFKKAERMQLLKENLQQPIVSKIALSLSTGVSFIETSDIIFIKADNVYSEFHLKENRIIVASKPIKDFEKILPSTTFFRCHRSYLVNMNNIIEYIKSEGGELKLTDGSKIPIARDRKEEFKRLWVK